VLAVGRAPIIFQNDWVCTRISNFFQSPNFSIARVVPEFSQNLALGSSEGRWRNDVTSHFRHIFVTFRHIPGSMWRCQVSKQFFSVLPKMWRFSWNLVQMWRFRHIVTSFLWVRLGTKQSFKTWPGPGFLVPGFPIPAWNDPDSHRFVDRVCQVTLVCDNGRGFPSKPCNFKASKVASFWMGSKDAPQKMQFLGAIKKVSSLDVPHQNTKVAGKPHRFGHHRSKIGLNPNVLAYSKSPWIGANMNIWVYE